MRVLMIGAALLAVSPASAQVVFQLGQTTRPDLSDSPVCRSVARGPDGSWTVLQPIEIDEKPVAAGTVYRADDVAPPNVHVAAQLDRACIPGR